MSSQRNVFVGQRAIDEKCHSTREMEHFIISPLRVKSMKKFSPIIIIAILGGILLTLVLIIILQSIREENLDDQTFLNRDRHWQSGKCEWRCAANFTVPPLLLISMDGFQAGYLERELTPAIARIYQCGSHAKYMFPSYPSKTFPNHYTIVTGLHPESHGIVDNNIYDENVTDSEICAQILYGIKLHAFIRNKNPRKYFKKNSLCSDWYNGEPIWNTVLKNNRKSAVFYWPGSEVPIQGLTPTYRMSYNRTTPFSTRIEGVINWLRLPEADRPSFIAMYMEQPDGEGHWKGPYSDEVNSALIYVDAMLNYLMFQLEKAELLGCVNIILVSDHGMQQLRDDHRVIISDLISNNSIIAFDGVMSGIIFKNKSVNIEQSIEKMKCGHGALYKVYDKRSIPRRYHYTQSSRIGDIILDGVAATKFFKTNEDASEDKGHGDHGYDNRMPTMRAIFAAMGPNIKSKAEIQPFQNIELYNLFADLMQLSHRAPNNGTQGVLHPILKYSHTLIESNTETVSECSVELTYRTCGDRCTNAKLTTSDQYCTIFTLPTIPLNNGSNSIEQCALQLCNASLYFDMSRQMPLYAISVLTHPKRNTDERAACTIFINELESENYTECPNESSADKSFQRITLFANDANYRFIAEGHLLVKNGFAEGIWSNLWQLIDEYRRHYKRLLLYAGPIFDNHSDGLPDRINNTNRINSTQPTHIFVILLRCNMGQWASDGQSCAHPEFTRTLSFALPNLPSDFNCLHPEEYLFDHTVSIRDIELLTGLHFFTDRTIWPLDVATLLRTTINEELWQLELV